MKNTNNLDRCKNTKAGLIPLEWQAKKISEIAYINPNNHEKILYKTEVSFLPMTNVSESGQIIKLDTRKYSEIGNGYTFFKEGDILIAKITPCFENGKGALAIGLKNGLGFGSTEFHVLRSKNINNKFLFLHTRTYRFKSHGEKNMTGSAGQKRVPTSFVSNFYIQVPPLKEQEKIVAILSFWDRAIESLEKLIDAKQRLKKGLMQQMLTGKMRFLQFPNLHKQKVTTFGNIPNEWSYVPISKIATQIININKEKQEFPILSCTKYDGLVDSLVYFGKQVFSMDTSSYKIVKRNCFAYATNHIEEGSIGYQNLYDFGLISPMYTVFRTNEKIDDGFLYKLLKTNLFTKIFKINTNASVNRRGSLRWQNFSKIHIPLPTIEEQQKISQMIDISEHEILVLDRKLKMLRKQKQGLMQKLLTGKVRAKL